MYKRQTFERAPIYFVTACTFERRKILARQTIHNTLVQFAEQGPVRGAWMGAYVLMPDHLHLFVSLDEQRINLSAWMKALKGTLSKAFRESSLVHPYWQKGFFDHLLRSSESYSEKWDYVRENPVRAGLVTISNQWPYQGEPFPLEFRGNL